MKKREEDLPIELLYAHEENRNIDHTYIEHFADNIEKEGWHGRIEVLDTKDKCEKGRYEILSGHRRVEAMKLLKEKTIPCIVYEELTEAQEYEFLIGSNINIENITPMDIAKNIKLYETYVVPSRTISNVAEETCKYFNITISSYGRYKRLLKLNESLQKICDDITFPYSSLTEVCNSCSEEEQNQIAERILQVKKEYEKDQAKQEAQLSNEYKTKGSSTPKRKNDSYYISGREVKRIVSDVQYETMEKERAKKKKSEQQNIVNREVQVFKENVAETTSTEKPNYKSIYEYASSLHPNFFNNNVEDTDDIKQDDYFDAVVPEFADVQSSIEPQYNSELKKEDTIEIENINSAKDLEIYKTATNNISKVLTQLDSLVITYSSMLEQSEKSVLLKRINNIVEKLK